MQTERLVAAKVTGQLVDKPTRGLDISRRGLDKSRTRQLADIDYVDTE